MNTIYLSHISRYIIQRFTYYIILTLNVVISSTTEAGTSVRPSSEAIVETSRRDHVTTQEATPLNTEHYSSQRGGTDVRN